MNDHNELSEGIDHGKTGRPPMQPRAKVTREAILEVSATLFSQTGYAGTSINDILAISETTKGAMYFHFSKKESIAQEMLHGWENAVSETVGKAAAIRLRCRWQCDMHGCGDRGLRGMVIDSEIGRAGLAPVHRWAIALDDGRLIFVNDEDLTPTE